ncbi:hypothetical protein LENED_006180 [Lentinula edodes]|uniref:Uncharacterized protein n=1 Tax=Lentinula edodes TaxID=5353 RepID=A0A1Q3EB27_LENED|nr:hypothetical protein LENED_006180 [Lentinula edodes]
MGEKWRVAPVSITSPLHTKIILVLSVHNKRHLSASSLVDSADADLFLHYHLQEPNKKFDPLGTRLAALAAERAEFTASFLDQELTRNTTALANQARHTTFEAGVSALMGGLSSMTEQSCFQRILQSCASFASYSSRASMHFSYSSSVNGVALPVR